MKYVSSIIQKIKKSRVFLAILTLSIGISYTSCFYEGRELYREIKIYFEPKTIVIVNHALAAEKKPAKPTEETADSYQVATIKRIAAERGIDWKLVYVVCLKESGCNPKLDCERQYGKCDDGMSFGAYQIYNPKLDPERKRMAENFEEATRWTIDHGYRFKDNPELFFKNHNGLYKTTNQWYVDGAMEIYKSL